ncbi:MAG: iron-containing alcohol dehydrogenase [Pirellulales bacterium]|nr:iron-containing alcohol dehydrogenase [Pirellulales bacterium]
MSFDFSPQTRIVSGSGRVDDLGPLAAELGVKRALVVSDSGIIAAGHTERGSESLRKSGLEVAVFDGVIENPTTHTVRQGVEFARDFRPDVLIGLGGGSSMDTAKGINFLYSCGGQMSDYWGVGKATGPMLASIGVPTTAGTGSEAQSFALISDEVTHVKMACGDKRAAFRLAVLDPHLTVTQPRSVTALTGIDALSHALESFVSTKRTALSQMFSRESWRNLEPNFSTVLRNPEDIAARSAMQWGACLAGMAIENSMLGAAHALANPLTQSFDIVHGQAIALTLPHVVRFNAVEREADYAKLEFSSNNGTAAPPGDLKAGERLARRVEALRKDAGLLGQLSEFDISREQIPELAGNAAKQWTATFNPRRVEESDLAQLYEDAY